MFVRCLISDAARCELTKVLLLLLGCAVQCERKEEFVESITSLQLPVQVAIADYIKQVETE